MFCVLIKNNKKVFKELCNSRLLKSNFLQEYDFPMLNSHLKFETVKQNKTTALSNIKNNSSLLSI